MTGLEGIVKKYLMKGSAHFIIKILYTFFTKRATLMTRSTLLNIPLQLVFPSLIHNVLSIRSRTEWFKVHKNTCKRTNYSNLTQALDQIRPPRSVK
jgi:hypothetical protein